MTKVNQNFLKLPGSYLFSEVARRISAYSAAHPQAKIIKLSIGDVTRPLAPAVIQAMHQAVADTLRDALPLMDRKLRGFAAPEGVLTGVETRSSSPVRILRDEGLQSALRGLYPCGEGAGYAGGIVSAAVDGIRVAEAVAGG